VFCEAAAKLVMKRAFVRPLDDVNAPLLIFHLSSGLIFGSVPGKLQVLLLDVYYDSSIHLGILPTSSTFTSASRAHYKCILLLFLEQLFHAMHSESDYHGLQLLG
jgi:hypothetical protein